LALETVEFPPHNLPSLALSAKPEYIDRKYIEVVANKLREGWGIGLGPIQNVVWLLEHQGVVIVRDQVATNHIDAFSCWRGSYPVIVLTAGKESAVRSRWDAAHELGHLILHREIDRTRIASKEGLAKIEQQADWFAGSFLLPADTFRRSIIIPSLEEFLKVKPHWMVSIQAQLQRAFALGMVSDAARARMWKQISIHGWRYREPLDDALEPEQPELLRKSIEMGIEDGTLDLQVMSTEIGVPANKIQSLLNLRQPTAKASIPPDNLLVFPNTGRRSREG
jgi:Zn-dependent peptidase ImmA (M78 family)